ncbi:MAG: CDP-glucose 4,6-dehydratase [Pseudomonadota bacterium]
MVTNAFWANKRVLITGHTGFKGSWLSLWLQLLGADVTGYSLPPPTVPSLYELSQAKEGMISIEGDIRDFSRIKESIEIYQPEIVIHMAAQSLVRPGYQDPLGTFSTNIMGTVHLLEAVRQADGVRAIINVTSDKCYQNNDSILGHIETDALGGFDPYSSSKGCAELITASYRNSFFEAGQLNLHGVALASVRAGNVIGGGDWAKDRLIPDIMRALLEKQEIRIRYPEAIRPWQHVLEPLSGYLILAEKLYQVGPGYAEAWNFGPDGHENRSVSWVAKYITQLWGGETCLKLEDMNQPHETRCLKLDSSKAKNRLGWAPRLTIEEALKWTVAWYKAYQRDPATIAEITRAQIKDYSGL